MADSAEPPAKRVKTEVEGGKMTAKEVEAVVLAECKKHPQWLAPPVRRESKRERVRVR
jgi:hypothetical protein